MNRKTRTVKQLEHIQRTLFPNEQIIERNFFKLVPAEAEGRGINSGEISRGDVLTI